MSEQIEEFPELTELLGSMILGAAKPLTMNEIRRTLTDTAGEHGGDAMAYAKVTDDELKAALNELAGKMEGARLGFRLVEAAGGFKLQTNSATAPWLRLLLNTGKPYRLSRPALETLAVIAYRQPVTRGDIEAVRGVNIDHIIRLLMEMQLVQIVGRSELPGRPMLYGTTKIFLEHFGIRDISELPGIEELSRVAPKQTRLPLAEAGPEDDDADQSGENRTEAGDGLREDTGGEAGDQDEEDDVDDEEEDDDIDDDEDEDEADEDDDDEDEEEGVKQ